MASGGGRIFSLAPTALSQKYQQLISYRYAAEQKIPVTITETELSGFDYQPSLWNLITGTWAAHYSDLILFSLLLLPVADEDRKRFFHEVDKRGITLHFVAEDLIYRPGQNTGDIEARLRAA